MSETELSEAVRLRSRVQKDVDRYRRMRCEVLAPESGSGKHTLAMVVLLAVSSAIMFTWYEALIIWVIATFILYSFNYIVFFLPITRRPGRRERKPLIPQRPISRALRYLLTERRGFTIEVLATMFLVGLVPLARSFFVLFGAGLVFTIYHGVLLGKLPAPLAAGLILQILVIMGYLVIVVLVSPQSQGFTDIARTVRRHIVTARSRGRSAYLGTVSAAGMLVLGISLMAVGAILLPGRTLDSLIGFLHGNTILHLLASIAILIAEFFIMRVLQSRGSRRMALTIIDDKVEALEALCAASLDELIADADDRGAALVDKDRLERVLFTYYPVTIYSVVETNLFGHLPVYLVVPDLDLIFDLEALEHVRHPRHREAPAVQSGEGPHA